MFARKFLTTLVFGLFALASVASEVVAQTATTFVTGLKSPVKIIYSQRYGVFFVSEAGMPTTVNTGRISIVGNDGSLSTLIDGLPSGPAAPNNDPSGPSAMWLDGNSLYIAIGAGNTVLSGPAPGSEIPNPNVASPIFQFNYRNEIAGTRQTRNRFVSDSTSRPRAAGNRRNSQFGIRRFSLVLAIGGEFSRFHTESAPGCAEQRASFQSVWFGWIWKQTIRRRRGAKPNSHSKFGQRKHGNFLSIPVASEFVAGTAVY